MIYFKNFFFFSSPPSIPFQKQVEQTLFSASIGHHIADQRSMCRGCLLDMCDYWVQDGTYLKPVLTILYITTEQMWGGPGGGGIPGCRPRLPTATYTCNHVNIVEGLRQKQRKYVYCRHVDCVGCRVATSNSCLCEWQTRMYVTTA